jgi:nucleoside-diphosphate-sugar epimerase
MARHPQIVTGGAGFIGRALVSRLTTLGHRVVVLDNLSVHASREAPAWPAGAELVRGDVRDRSLVQSVLERERPATLYHLAAIHYIPLGDEDRPSAYR